jgi:hypothetical protein
VFRQEAAGAVAGDDQGEHAEEGHEDKVVVAVGVAGVSAGMAMHLGHDGQAHGACRPGGVPGGGFAGFHELGAAAAGRLVEGEHDGVAACLAAEPPH